MVHMGRGTRLRAAAGAAAMFLPANAMAQAAQPVTMNGANTAWILTATALVLFMTLPGLALFYGGLVRAKNVLSVLMHCFAWVDRVFCATPFARWASGFTAFARRPG